jgi:hypothetical protein
MSDYLGPGWRLGAADFQPGLRVQFVSTPLLDLLTLNDQKNFDFSTVAGFKPAATFNVLFWTAFYCVTQQTGGAATVQGGITLFNGASAFGPSPSITIGTSTINSGLAVPYAPAVGTPRSVATLASLITGPLSAKVTTAVSGPTTLKARIILGMYIDSLGIVT